MRFIAFSIVMLIAGGGGALLVHQLRDIVYLRDLSGKSRSAALKAASRKLHQLNEVVCADDTLPASAAVKVMHAGMVLGRRESSIEDIVSAVAEAEAAVAAGQSGLPENNEGKEEQ